MREDCQRIAQKWKADLVGLWSVSCTVAFAVFEASPGVVFLAEIDLSSSLKSPFCFPK